MVANRSDINNTARLHSAGNLDIPNVDPLESSCRCSDEWTQLKFVSPFAGL